MNPQQTAATLQNRDQIIERKTNKGKATATASTTTTKNAPTKTPSKGQQFQRSKLDKLMKMRRHQRKNAENSKSQSSFSPPVDCNTSTARAQNWMEDEMDELTEVGFRSWVVTNFTEEHK